MAAAAGDTTQKASANAVGTYTYEARAAIRKMLGAFGTSNVSSRGLYVEVDSDTGESYLGANVQDVQVNGTSIVNNYVANVPVASSAIPGVIKVESGSSGLNMLNGTLIINKASASDIKTGTNNYRPIVPSSQDDAVFYGLAAAAGDNTQSASENSVGTYTSAAKTAIRTMLGAIGDVQVNGTSIVSNGVANVPIASPTTPGVAIVRDSSDGLKVDSSNRLILVSANASMVKGGTSAGRAITPNVQDASTFYGLAKAAGDNTQASSNNAVGTYTDNAKASIKSMLGIVDGSTAVVEVSGATPTITALENTRYNCGEVTSISITPSASGICIVRFSVGTTPATLTLPNTVIMPEWFDTSDLETSRTYEICITDGVYGAVMSWAQ